MRSTSTEPPTLKDRVETILMTIRNLGAAWLLTSIPGVDAEIPILIAAIAGGTAYSAFPGLRSAGTALVLGCLAGAIGAATLRIDAGPAGAVAAAAAVAAACLAHAALRTRTPRPDTA